MRCSCLKIDTHTRSCDDMPPMIPGPTNVPEFVRLAMAAQCIYHRGPEFAALLDDCIRGLQQVIGTARPAVLTASGTGGVEAAVARSSLVTTAGAQHRVRQAHGRHRRALRRGGHLVGLPPEGGTPRS